MRSILPCREFEYYTSFEEDNVKSFSSIYTDLGSVAVSICETCFNMGWEYEVPEFIMIRAKDSVGEFTKFKPHVEIVPEFTVTEVN